MRDFATGDLHVIDYEYGSYNYRGYEFGNHFCEWIIDYSYPKHPKYMLKPAQYPTENQKETLFRSYLTKLNELQGKKGPVTKEQIYELQKEADYFIMVPHFAWSLWAIVQAGSSKIDFGYMEYAIERIEQYFELKEKLFLKYKLYGTPADGVKLFEERLKFYNDKVHEGEAVLENKKQEKILAENLARRLVAEAQQSEDILKEHQLALEEAQKEFDHVTEERIKAEQVAQLTKDALSKAEKEA